MLSIFTKPQFTPLLNWLLPQSCFLCGDTCTRPICTACLADLPYQRTDCPICAKKMVKKGICFECRQHPPPYTLTQTVFSYTHPINKLIHAVKFHQNLAMLRLLGDLMGQRLMINPRPEVLIPVPLHYERLRQRGYNQSLELAKRITKSTGIPLDYQACKRIKNTLPQTTLSGQQRQTNIKGAFQVLPRAEYWQHIVIIDDVMTTGNTVRELATVFKEAGVPRVDVWCCARRSAKV